MIGNVLKNMRLTAQLSQKELGDILALADTTVSSYERENSQPSFDMIMKIAEECGFEFRIVDTKKNLVSVEDMSKEMDF